MYSISYSVIACLWTKRVLGSDIACTFVYILWRNYTTTLTNHVFPLSDLQVLGFEVDSINSVQFSNHTGETLK